MRQHARRSTEMPMRYYGYGMPEPKTGQLRNASLSGLSFKSHYHFQSSTQLIVHIPYINPLFKTFASVVWCNYSDSFYDVGIKFHDINGDTRKIMFEQICLTENYRTEILKTEGRTITSEQAAREMLSLLGSNITV
jgi:hypothetical protein